MESLSTTLFANKRYKGVISFGIYIVFELLIGKVADLVTNGAVLLGNHMAVG